MEGSGVPGVVSPFHSLRDRIAKPSEAALNVGPLREVPLPRARGSWLGASHVTAGTRGRAGGCSYNVWPGVSCYCNMQLCSDGTDGVVGLA